jgi:hypothetical protein
MTGASENGPERLSGSLSGDWHLVHEDADEGQIPGHRMDLRFVDEPDRLRAAVLSRGTGQEMLVIHSASFDGRLLCLQLVAPDGQPQAAMPILEMRAAGETLRGHWLHDGLPLGPGLKLIRAGQSGLA